MFDKDYLDRIEQRVFAEGLALHEKGNKIVGVYCAFTPKEIIAASGAIPVALCAGDQKPIEAGEKHLPRNLCPLIKASYGFALTDTCPYLHYCDFLLADATCDGKKKMFELLGRIKWLHLMQLPQTSGTRESYEYWLGELYKIKAIIEEKTGVEITDSALRKQIKLYNKMRKTINKVFSLNKGEYPLLYGYELDNITGYNGFEVNLQKRVSEMEEVIEIVGKRAYDSSFIDSVKSKARILVTGCPTTNRKVLELIESSDAIVVAMENCGGLKTAGDLVDETKGPMEALAETYLSVACPCMTPNTKRLDIIGKIIDEYWIDGVVELVWQGCHTYNIEAFQIKEFVTGKCNRPYIQIETDYSENDREQIRVRIEAFIEMLS